EEQGCDGKQPPRDGERAWRPRPRVPPWRERPRRGLAGAPGVFAGLSQPRRYSCIDTEKTEKMGLRGGSETNTGLEQRPKKRSFAPEIG
ncbi:unnamed protein product, partial [Rangifer tarandus platyrhynchus]